MRKLFFISILACSTLFLKSCNNDEPEQPLSIVGTWHFESFNFNITTSDPQFTLELREMFRLIQISIDGGTIVFRENGTYTETMHFLGQPPDIWNGVYSWSNGILSMDGQIISHDLTNERLTLRLSARQMEFEDPRIQTFIVTTTYTR